MKQRITSDRLAAAALGLLCVLPLTGWAESLLSNIRLASQPDKTRVVLQFDTITKPTIFTLDQPNRVVIDLADTTLSTSLPKGDGVVKGLRAGPRDKGALRIVLDTTAAVTPRWTWLEAEAGSGPRLVIDLPTSAAKSAATSSSSAVTPVAAPTTTETAPAIASPAATASSSTASLPTAVKSASASARELIIAVDAGHGGEDPGAIGRNGAQEKQVTLAIARLLKERLDAEPGMRAVLTRDGDYFVPLRDRINHARQQQADMFISIHADSVVNSRAAGSSVYTLSLKGATNEAARFLADRENAADLVGGVSLDNKNGVLASVLLDLTQGASMSASLEAAGSVLKQLDKVGDMHHSVVQQAGFVVLKSPDIPSMLVETAFISNPAEEARLVDPKHQARIADAVLTGVRDYFYSHTPPGTRLAQIKATRQAANRP